MCVCVCVQRGRSHCCGQETAKHHTSVRCLLGRGERSLPAGRVRIFWTVNTVWSWEQHSFMSYTFHVYVKMRMCVCVCVFMVYLFCIIHVLKKPRLSYLLKLPLRFPLRPAKMMRNQIHSQLCWTCHLWYECHLCMHHCCMFWLRVIRDKICI